MSSSRTALLPSGKAECLIAEYLNFLDMLKVKSVSLSWNSIWQSIGDQPNLMIRSFLQLDVENIERLLNMSRVSGVINQNIPYFLETLLKLPPKKISQICCLDEVFGLLVIRNPDFVNKLSRYVPNTKSSAIINPMEECQFIDVDKIALDNGDYLFDICKKWESVRAYALQENIIQQRMNSYLLGRLRPQAYGATLGGCSI
jgi:hypothetical protein